MKKNLSTILSAICCLLLLFSLIQINSLKEEVSSLRNRLTNEMQNVESRIHGISGEVRAALEEEANLLSASGWEYGGIDVKNKSAEVLCSLVPKVYAPETTRAFLLCNGEEIPMAYENGRYTARLELPLFAESRVEQVLFHDGDTVRTQNLDWHIAPRYEALPHVYADTSGSWTGRPGADTYTWEVKHSVHVNVEKKGPFSLRSVELVETLDGKEIGRIPVDMSAEGQQAYAQAAAKEGQAVPERLGETAQPAGLHVEYDGRANFLYYLEKTYSIPHGSELALFVDVVDGEGLRYRSFADGLAIGADGDVDERRADHMRMFRAAEPLWIFDENGEVLYEIAEEYFG